ncbi:MAG: fibrobacter succinogenes major paralogous domain-containing protein [Fibromonadaceae bacterium]|jgi:uncharacterized protein (TIGR02145 family)|nr:fibrobacter succinogenes major paralogous domain-containing protein [Fibromonadaceae bacterium]
MATCPNCEHEFNEHRKKNFFIVALVLAIAGLLVAYKYDYIENLRGGVLVDSRDRQKYKIIKIGEQVWMQQNLNIQTGYSVCYGNSDENCEKYGRLYDWVTALTACPKGWRLPSYDEWQDLIDYMGGTETSGKVLKSTSGWEEGGNGMDTHGFSALPGGQGYSNAVFYSAGTSGNWWTSTEQDEDNAYYRNIFYGSRDVYDSDGSKMYLFSVRCVK